MIKTQVNKLILKAIKLKKQTSSYTISTLHAVLSCFYSPLFSIPIDLSISDSQYTVPIYEEKQGFISFDFYNIHPSTIYVVKFSNEIQSLACTSPNVTLGTNNCFVIENENQLTEIKVTATLLKDSVKQTIEISKMVIRTDEYSHLGNEIWGLYIDKIRNKIKPRVATECLVNLTKDHPLQHVLTIGCESGEDPLYFAARRTNVTILDGTPHAIAITGLRMAEYDFHTYLNDALVCTLENIHDDLGFFDAVTGGQVFSFILPNQFNEMMSTKVLSHVAPSGYFSGHFLSTEHEWKDDPKLTFVTMNDLTKLFTQNGFEILWVNEMKENIHTAMKGNVFWHEFQVVARKQGEDFYD